MIGCSARQKDEKDKNTEKKRRGKHRITKGKIVCASVCVCVREREKEKERESNNEKVERKKQIENER